MSTIHLCNTFFERELSGQTSQGLQEAFANHPIFLQLQFLPLIYADPSDGILVTARPKEIADKRLYLLEERPQFDRLETWGYSKLAKKWADERGIAYDMPPWDLVKRVNSKAYSFEKSPLPGAKLIHSGDPIPPHTLLKSCFGTAGGGHLFSDHPRAKNFCKKQWEMGLPVLSEPWVQKTLDFSTQWSITPSAEIEFLGVTFCTTSPSGAHQSNRAGDHKGEEQFAPFIEAQKKRASEVLKEMAGWGYFGEVGFDAMIYGDGHLQPIVEINARKTMGWVALALQKKKFSTQTVEMAYIPSRELGPLPKIGDQNKFSRQLIITL